MRYVIIGVVLLGSAGLVAAQCYSAPVRHYASYQPVYVPPVVTYTPILVPAYSFQFLSAVQTPAQVPAQAPAANYGSPMREPALSVSQAGGDDWPAVPAPSAGQHAAMGVLSATCARCHTMPARSGVDLFDREGRVLSHVSRDRLFKAAQERAMPPEARKNPAAAVPQRDLALLQQWASNQ